ncbi:unnamed protein product [Bursaphelenchus xylophilus]|uniref:(pine wood nematode) hypothetical protein n=1 Tax=Bursaphelenchus xylophilus TaxID=6326 RepID=A0A1I7S5P3_BURXY|nr:unnamed protein product [Bursaphelenchus xylophilus]CAG9124928.1 unnamed protein product [Bursaphelenchus xylophilus]
MIVRNFQFSQCSFKRFLSTSIRDIRNIGIIAHIDAGKTTVTERILYLCGTTKYVGDVDKGNTVTDFMDMERERGITIQSAAVTTFYKDKRINLIDTPGHVDFTFEVERSVRILDGVVVVLDGSAGVQAQTLTVWKQASRNKLPSVFFVNKMDKPNADYSMSIDSIQQKLGIAVAPLVVPFFKEEKLVGFLNVLESTVLLIGSTNWEPIKTQSLEFDLLLQGRQQLFEIIAEHDDRFADKFLSTEDTSKIATSNVISALRRCTLSTKLAALSSGTALRSTESVLPLLDMIVDYLPSPDLMVNEIPEYISTCGLVFKVGHDKRKGQLNFVRIYKGELAPNQPVNLNNVAKEVVHTHTHQLFIPFSDDLEPVQKVEAGNIAVIAGLEGAVTGDTVTESRRGDPFILHGIQYPEPAFFCSVEPPNIGMAVKMEKALEELCIEDPSFRVRTDSESGQMIVESMGELHIEVLKHRLKKEYGLDVFLGKMRVNFKEVPHSTSEVSATVEDTLDQKTQWCTLKIELEPVSVSTPFKKAEIALEEEDAPFIKREWLNAINEGVKNALFNGPVLGYPVQGVGIKIRRLDVSGGRINTALLSACASEAVSKALKESGTFLVEPLMDLEVEVIGQKEGIISSIINELTRRRAEILDSSATGVKARLPLSESDGLARSLRSVSSGLSTFHMKFKEYQQVAGDRISALRAENA